MKESVLVDSGEAQWRPLKQSILFKGLSKIDINKPFGPLAIASQKNHKKVRRRGKKSQLASIGAKLFLHSLGIERQFIERARPFAVGVVDGPRVHYEAFVVAHILSDQFSHMFPNF